MSILERWEESKAVAVCGKGGKTFANEFANASEEKKTEIVLALQSPGGIGAAVWDMIRNDRKRRNQAAADAVRNHAKTHGLGRMPQ